MDAPGIGEIDTCVAPDGTLLAERARLVRWCARLTGDRDVAEDLAQEALFLGHRLRR